MLPTARYSLLILFLAAICLSPAFALQDLREVDLSPASLVLPPGTRLNASAEIGILPSGASTFPGGHTLVLSTDLLDARWDVSVMVDGHQAAVIPKQGDVVFINGFLLSYPDNRDVAVTIAVEGDVPELPDKQRFNVLRLMELNNQGSPVGGSDQQVTRTASRLPTLTPTTASAVDTSVPATEAGLSVFPVLSGIALAFLWTVGKKT